MRMLGQFSNISSNLGLYYVWEKVFIKPVGVFSYKRRRFEFIVS